MPASNEALKAINALKASAILATISAFSLSIAETYINWGHWQWWPYWLVDYIAALLLAIGSILTFKNSIHASKWLCTGWAFAIGMGWMSLSSNFDLGVPPERAAKVGGYYIAMIVFGGAIALSGLALALIGQNKKEIKTVSSCNS